MALIRFSLLTFFRASNPNTSVFPSVDCHITFFEIDSKNYYNNYYLLQYCILIIIKHYYLLLQNYTLKRTAITIQFCTFRVDQTIKRTIILLSIIRLPTTDGLRILVVQKKKKKNEQQKPCDLIYRL